METMAFGTAGFIPPLSQKLSADAVDMLESLVQTTALQLSYPEGRKKADRPQHVFDLATAAALHRLAMEVRYRNSPKTRPVG